MIVLDIILCLVIAFIVSSVNILCGFEKAVQILIASVVITIMIKLLPKQLEK